VATTSSAAAAARTRSSARPATTSSSAKQADFLNGGTGQNRLFGGTPGAPQQEFNNVCVNGPNDKLTNCQVFK
jgi:hypothetical protein